MFCPYCGDQLSDGFKFCPKCGRQVSGLNDNGVAQNKSEDQEPAAPNAGGVQAPPQKRFKSQWWKFWVKKERSALKSCGMLVLGFIVAAVGDSVATVSTVFFYLDNRSSEYSRLLGQSSPTSLQWIIFVVGCLIDIFGMAVLYSGLMSLLHKIKPARRSDSVVAKAVAVSLCVAVYLLISLAVQAMGAKHMTIWDFLIFCAICSAIWRGVVGEKHPEDRQVIVNMDSIKSINSSSKPWAIFIVVILGLIGLPAVTKFHGCENVSNANRPEKKSGVLQRINSYDRDQLINGISDMLADLSPLTEQEQNRLARLRCIPNDEKTDDELLEAIKILEKDELPCKKLGIKNYTVKELRTKPNQELRRIYKILWLHFNS